MCFQEYGSNKYLEHKILEPIPFIFYNNFENFLYWKSQLSYKIDVDSRSIAIVGSAALGYSINPSKNFKVYDSDSDVDIAIVSQFYFDLSWRTIRRIGSKFHSLPPVIQHSIDDHVKRLIFWGTIATDKILPVLPFNMQWTEAKNIIKEIEPTRGRDINFRIYKDFESLRVYQLNGIKQAQAKLLEE